MLKPLSYLTLALHFKVIVRLSRFIAPVLLCVVLLHFISNLFLTVHITDKRRNSTGFQTALILSTHVKLPATDFIVRWRKF